MRTFGSGLALVLALVLVLALALVLPVALGGCSDKRSSAPSPSGARAPAPQPSARATWPADVPALLAKLPNDADDVFVQRQRSDEHGLREDLVDESLTALAALVWTQLPLPDEPIFAATIHASHRMLYALHLEGDHAFVVWYEGLGTILDGALPRALGAAITPAAYRGTSGCVEDSRARDVRGVQVHGSADSLYVSLCLPDGLTLKAGGELHDRMVDAVAARRFGASPAAARVGTIPPAAWAVAAWSRAVDGVAGGRIVARDLGKRTTITLELDVATGDPQALVARIADAHARPGLPWLAAITPTVAGATVTVTYELDATRHAALWALVPDNLSGTNVLEGRPAALRTLGAP